MTHPESRAVPAAPAGGARAARGRRQGHAARAAGAARPRAVRPATQRPGCRCRVPGPVWCRECRCSSCTRTTSARPSCVRRRRRAAGRLQHRRRRRCSPPPTSPASSASCRCRVPAGPAQLAARAVAALPFLPPAGSGSRRPAHPAIMDTTRAKRELGWAPHYTGLEALRDTLVARRDELQPRDHAARVARRRPRQAAAALSTLTLHLRAGRRDQRPGGRAACSAPGLQPRRHGRASQLPNIPQFLFTYFGILKAGLTMVPMNPLLKAPEVGYHLREQRREGCWSPSTAFAAEAAKGAAEAGDVPLYVVHTGPASAGAGPTDAATSTRCTSTEALDIEPHRPRRHRGAHLHQRHHRQAQGRRAHPLPAVHELPPSAARDSSGYREDDVGLAVLPLFHVFGLSSVHGRRRPLRRHDGPGAALRGARGARGDRAGPRHACSAACPTMFIALLHADLGGRDLSSLRVASPAGRRSPAR